MVKDINIYLYASVIEHRSLLLDILRCMWTIQSQHRYFLREGFRELFGKTAQEHFLEPLEWFRNHEQSYESALHEGVVKIAQSQIENLSLKKKSPNKP